jgi:uncharacterized protein with PQ loop repeat
MWLTLRIMFINFPQGSAIYKSKNGTNIEMIVLIFSGGICEDSLSWKFGIFLG